MSDVTKEERDLLEHTLGVGMGGSRNHFVAGETHSDIVALRSLCAKGLMQEVAPPAFCPPTDIVFVATRAGRQVVGA